ncbi:Nephrin [Halotydeus destructor]|nr:Nephrin [Halotydeus destructor]
MSGTKSDLGGPGGPGGGGGREGASRNAYIVEAREGDKVTLECSASQSQPPPTIKWFRKHIELLPEASRTYYNKTTPVDSKIAMFSADSSITLYPKNDEQYACEVHHPGMARPLRATVSLHLLSAPASPVIEGFREGDFARVGQSLTLTCTSRKGYPLPQVVWFRNGVEVDRTWVASARGEVVNAHTFSVGPDDNQAVFRCSVTNSQTSKPVESAIRLNVHYAPSEPSLLGYSAGSPVLVGSLQKFKCVSLHGNPRAELKWYKGEQEISAITSVTGSGVSSELVIRPTMADNGTIYRCRASSPALSGPLVAEFKLTVASTPEAPVNLRLINKTQDSLLVTWDPQFDGGLEQSFRVRYHEQPPLPPVQGSAKAQLPLDYSHVQSSNNLTTLMVTGLKGDTKYIASVIASNKLGDSLPSRSLQVTTDPLERSTTQNDDTNRKGPKGTSFPDMYGQAPAPGEPRLDTMGGLGLMGDLEEASLIIIACAIISLVALSTASAFVVVACYRRRQSQFKRPTGQRSVSPCSSSDTEHDHQLQLAHSQSHQRHLNHQSNHGHHDTDQPINLVPSTGGGHLPRGLSSPPSPFVISDGSGVGLALGYYECQLAGELCSLPAAFDFPSSAATDLAKCLCVGDYSDFATKLMSPIGHQQPDILMNQIKEPECINHSVLCTGSGTFKLMSTSESDIESFGNSNDIASSTCTNYSTSTSSSLPSNGRVSIVNSSSTSGDNNLELSSANSTGKVAGSLNQGPLSTLLEEVEEMV